MPVYSVEDIIQMVFGSVCKAVKVMPITGGARKHAELPSVATVYAQATNRMTLPSAKRFIRMYATEDMYWVDSATTNNDASTKLNAAGSRGFLPKGTVLEMTLPDGITRLDFLAVTTAGAVYVTSMD